MKTASWVIREKVTGKVVMETFNPQVVAKLNTKKFEAVPIHEHLASLNRNGKCRFGKPHTIAERANGSTYCIECLKEVASRRW